MTATCTITNNDIVQTPAWTNLLVENFDGVFPGQWQMDSFWYDGADWWDITAQVRWGQRNCRAYSAPYGAWPVGAGSVGGTKTCMDGYPYDIENWMVYGPLNLSQAYDGSLSAKIWMDIEQDYDILFLSVSTNNQNFYGYSYTGNSGGWITRSIDLKNVYTLGNVTGQPQVWIGVLFATDSGNTIFEEGAAVDDLKVSICTSPTGCSGSPSFPDNSLDTDSLLVKPAFRLKPTGITQRNEISVIR